MARTDPASGEQTVQTYAIADFDGYDCLFSICSTSPQNSWQGARLHMDGKLMRRSKSTKRESERRLSILRSVRTASTVCQDAFATYKPRKRLNSDSIML